MDAGVGASRSRPAGSANAIAVSHVRCDQTQLLLLGDGWIGARLGTYRPASVLPTRHRRLARGHSELEQLVFHVPPAVLRRAKRVVLVVNGSFHAPHGNGEWRRHTFERRQEIDRFVPQFAPTTLET
jgi:hypothetical protein